MTAADPGPVERLVLALADGLTMREAALASHLSSGRAVQEAKAFGWPDLDAIRAAAEEIRDRTTTTDLPGGDPMPPRTREPIPLEPDVAEAMTAGARATAQARTALAASTAARDAAAEEALASVNLEPQPAAGRGLAAAVGIPERIPERDPIDQALIDDTQEILGMVERISGVLTVEQLQRVQALREVNDLVTGATAIEFLALADYIVTGRSSMSPGGEGR